jgi:hypothetical protein
MSKVDLIIRFSDILSLQAGRVVAGLPGFRDGGDLYSKFVFEIRQPNSRTELIIPVLRFDEWFTNS